MQDHAVSPYRIGTLYFAGTLFQGMVIRFPKTLNGSTFLSKGGICLFDAIKDPLDTMDLSGKQPTAVDILTTVFEDW